MPEPAQAAPSRPLHALALALPLLAGLWLIWTSISEPFPDMSIWDGKRLAEVYLYPVLLGLTLLHPGLRAGFAQAVTALPRWWAAGFGAFLLLGVVSSLRLPHPGYPLAEVAQMALLACGVLALAASRLHCGRDFERLALVLIAVLGVAVFLLELVAVSAYLGSGFQYSYAESLIRFGHPRMYNQVQTWTLPLLALLPLAFPDRTWLRVVTPLLIGLQWYILALTAARGSIISLVAAFILLAVLAPRWRGLWLRPQALGLLVGLLLYGAMSAFLHTSQPELDSFVKQSAGRPMVHTSGRTYLWELAVQDVAANPWLGAGPAMYACDAKWPIASSPHNFPLQVLAEWGIPAFLLLGALAAWACIGLWRAVAVRARDPDTAGDYAGLRLVSLATAATAAVIHAQVSGILIAPASHVTGVLVLGWLWGVLTVRVNEPGTRPSAPGLAPLVVLATGLGIAVTLAGFARSEWPRLGARTPYAVDYGVAAPRFWRDGRVCLYRWESP